MFYSFFFGMKLIYSLIDFIVIEEEKNSSKENNNLNSNLITNLCVEVYAINILRRRSINIYLFLILDWFLVTWFKFGWMLGILMRFESENIACYVNLWNLFSNGYVEFNKEVRLCCFSPHANDISRLLDLFF